MQNVVGRNLSLGEKDESSGGKSLKVAKDQNEFSLKTFLSLKYCFAYHTHCYFILHSEGFESVLKVYFFSF